MGLVFAAGVIAAAVHARRRRLTRSPVFDIVAVAATLAAAVAMPTARPLPA
jgi:hypothetical protein